MSATLQRRRSQNFLEQVDRKNSTILCLRFWLRWSQPTWILEFTTKTSVRGWETALSPLKHFTFDMTVRKTLNTTWMSKKLTKLTPLISFLSVKSSLQVWKRLKKDSLRAHLISLNQFRRPSSNGGILVKTISNSTTLNRWWKHGAFKVTVRSFLTG